MIILKLIWFLLPALVANLSPPIIAKLFPKLNYPMDFGYAINGRRLLGAHKTFRGFIGGIVLAAFTFELQSFLASKSLFLKGLEINPLFYELWWLGAWMGFTALLGDLIKSLFKRQLGIASGRSWTPWDQIDWVIGVFVGTFTIFHYDLAFALGIILIGGLLSFMGKIIGYWIGINKSWI